MKGSPGNGASMPKTQQPSKGSSGICQHMRLGYSDRNWNLKALGFSNYREYLQSQLWYDIKSRILKRDSYRCRLCRNKGLIPHHNSYSLDSLAGKNIDDIVTVCKKCHELIEFHEGSKRSFKQAVSKFNYLFKGNPGKKPIDLTRRVQRRKEKHLKQKAKCQERMERRKRREALAIKEGYINLHEKNQARAVANRIRRLSASRIALTENELRFLLDNRPSL